MRNMAVLHSPAFSYPLPVLVRVLFNLLIFKGKILYYNKYKVTQMQLICIYTFTQKQSREGHEEEWHGVYPCHAESLGRRNSS